MVVASVPAANALNVSAGSLWISPDLAGTEQTIGSIGESEAVVPVLMDLKRIIINEINDQQIIILREVEGERSFPIVIGMFEAISIDRRIKGTQWPRPMTHDLIVNLVNDLGGDLQDIYINDLRDHTYFAQLRVRRDGELVPVDCRPSDAIAVAVTAKVPIYVAESVLDEASNE